MSITRFIKKLIFPNTYNNEAYIKYLESKHIKIGDGCIFYSPNKISIDVERGHMLKIGNYVKVTSGVKILTHDYSRSVLCNMSEYGNVGEAGCTIIEDNVFIGVNSIILMGAKIGRNCIVGASSVVTGSFPDNVVIAGNPAKVICTLSEYYEKRKQKELDEAKEYVRCWRETYNCDPTIEDMTNSFIWLYLPRTEQSIKQYERMFRLNGVNQDIYIDTFMKSKPVYNSFEDFLNDCKD